MTDYAALAADRDPQAVKAAVNLAAVVMHAGIDLEPLDARLVGLCPFHVDSAPSFAVWRWADTGGWACGCWACGFGPGDVFDFLKALHQCSFGEAISHAVELRDMDLPEPEMPDPVKAIAAYDLGSLLRYASGSETLVEALVQGRGIDLTPDWLTEEWGLVGGDTEVLVPHYDADSRLIGVKRRWPPSWTPVAARGSNFSALYGTWRDRRRAHVILCEGESDAWSVSSWFPETDVLALPAGAAARPSQTWTGQLTGRTVYLLFDADRAGREATSRWAEALADCTVLAVELPDGQDATSAGQSVVQLAVEDGIVLSDAT